MISRLHPKTKTLLGGLALAALASSASAADFVLSDFEAGGPTNNLFGYWFFYGDADSQGNSKITTCDSLTSTFDTSSVAGPGNAGSSYSARLGFVFGDKMPSCGAGCTYDQEVAIGTDLRVGADTVMNLTGATAITFFAKAVKPVKVKFAINLATVTDFSHYSQTIDVGTEWKEHTVQLKASPVFAQPNWGKPVPWNNAVVQTLNWVVTKGLNKTMTSDTLYVDDVKILGWEPTGLRRIHQVTRSGLRLQEGPQGLTLTVPSDMRNRAGFIRIDDLAGREAATARYTQGQETVIVTPASLRRSQGPFFARILPGQAASK
jgi:hypothetical protein